MPVTFGSDAHAPTEVAADLSAACELMREAGYTEFVRYERRQTKTIPLSPVQAERESRRLSRPSPG